ncbi:cytidine deaminase [Pseudoclavibacter sp. RFBG4]|uniref:cytidine deaminase family protein n=1 Tax=Pseudoclavibacter sp. RFBG4 TaxID=2080575 RepID=UPI000CE851EF|nr:cytidine deaminase [Pseudoclavibacter sp. RFBG4]PPG34373.1 cytidine deaminase [Pseudoclavibacter sp. RFBG4]
MTAFELASARPVSEGEIELVEAARSTIDATTDAGPDEDGIHTVGAAVRAVDGRVHVGVNLHHFTGGPCAELVALGSARAAGALELTHIVAVANHGRGVMSPCGRDRQVLADHYPDIRVILPGPDGLISVVARELLPLAYDHASAQV